MVKIALKILSEQEFAKILDSQFNGVLYGGALDDIDIFRVYRPPLQGSGFLDIISSLGKFILPAMRKFIAPAASEFAHGMIDDLADGKSIKKAIRDRGKHSLKKIGSRILHGRGVKSKKRKKNIKRLNNTKKKSRKIKITTKSKSNKKMKSKKCSKKKRFPRHINKKYQDIFT